VRRSSASSTEVEPLGGGTPPSVTALVQQLDAKTPDGQPDYDAQREAAAALIEAMRPLISLTPRTVENGR
jgi:hypothetical protein